MADSLGRIIAIPLSLSVDAGNGPMFRLASSASYLAGSTIDDPNGFFMGFLAVLAGIVAFVVAIARVLG